MKDHLTWERCKGPVWSLIEERRAAGGQTVEGVFRAAGIPTTTGYEMFGTTPRRVKFENVMRLLRFLDIKPSWLDQFVSEPAPKKRKPAKSR